jgi:hypothetical protein
MTEHPIQQQIRIACSRGPVRLWRNNVGALRDENGRLVRYGLCPGSADLIGLKRLPSGLGRFVALEVKRPGGRPTTEQRNWLATVEEMGGLAAVVRSVEEADALLRGAP